MAITETDHFTTIAIIGGGFCGVLTAVHLLRSESANLRIHIINKGHTLARGVAYEPHTGSLLLNVPNGTMSAFPDIPDHYVLWLKKEYPGMGFNENIQNEFSPRKFYGDYLSALLKDAVQTAGVDRSISFHEDYAEDVCDSGGSFHISLQGGSIIVADKIVLATGNGKPRLPTGVGKLFEQSRLYHADPWDKACLENADTQNDILIIGAGLTTVDTIIGLIENGFKGTIHTISPNGYRLKPWKEDKPDYKKTIIDNIDSLETGLLDLSISFNCHRKIAAQLGQSVYPLVDSLRPYVQKLWQGFSINEKQQFIRYIKPFWEKVRHRLPCEQYQKMEELFSKGKLIAHKGRIVSIDESGNKAVALLNIDENIQEFKFDSVINCTGPETDIRKINDVFLTNLINKGWITQGPCGLGINANPVTGNVINAKGDVLNNISVIGSHLKGVLWESTAIPELRVQAKIQAEHLLKQINRSGETAVPVK